MQVNLLLASIRQVDLIVSDSGTEFLIELSKLFRISFLIEDSSEVGIIENSIIQRHVVCRAIRTVQHANGAPGYSRVRSFPLFLQAPTISILIPIKLFRFFKLVLIHCWSCNRLPVIDTWLVINQRILIDFVVVSLQLRVHTLLHDWLFFILDESSLRV